MAKQELLGLLLSGAKSRHCGIYLHHLESIQRHCIYQELESERLNDKYQRIKRIYSQSISNWNQVFLIGLFDSLSDMKNRENYILIAQIIHYTVIQRERGSLQNIEALLIGASGLIDLLPNDSYTKSLRDSAKFLIHKYNITPLDSSVWNMKGMTTVKHPILRLSQVAHLLFRHEHPFNQLIHLQNRNEIIAFFNVEASFELCKRIKGGSSSSRIGVHKSDLLGINFVVPMLYAYGSYCEDEAIANHASYINEQLPAESNVYITAWEKQGLTPQSAYETQALIQLAKRYCDERRCEECPIYQHINSPYSILDRIPVFTEFQR